MQSGTVRWFSPKYADGVMSINRSKVIQLWFAAVALVVLAAIALGANVTIGTGILLLAMCLVPPAIVVMLWPAAQSPSAAEMLHGPDRRS